MLEAEIELATARRDVKPTPVPPKPPAVALDYETPAGRTRVQTLRMLYREQLIDDEELLVELRALEMPEELAVATLDNEATRRVIQGVQDRGIALPAYRTAAGKVRVAAARLRFRQGVADVPDLYGDLLEQGVPEELADAIVEYELARRQQSTA
jgi:hypothetical protein